MGISHPLSIIILIIFLFYIPVACSATMESDLLAKATQGDAKAQNDLGVCYYNGDGVEQDYEKAVYWFTKAAEEGLVEAQNNLGLLYYGEGGWQDYEKAVYWLTKAAEQGHASAQNNLGFHYRNGYGVKKDEVKAVEWYTKAAKQDRASAQYNLGYCYYHGYGVEKDYEKAVYWYKKAAEQGHAWAQSNLGNCYYHGYGVEKNEAKAVEWYKKAAKQGNEMAQKGLDVLNRNVPEPQSTLSLSQPRPTSAPPQWRPEQQWSPAEQYELNQRLLHSRTMFPQDQAWDKRVFEARSGHAPWPGYPEPRNFW